MITIKDLDYKKMWKKAIECFRDYSVSWREFYQHKIDTSGEKDEYALGMFAAYQTVADEMERYEGELKMFEDNEVDENEKNTGYNGNL